MGTAVSVRQSGPPAATVDGDRRALRAAAAELHDGVAQTLFVVGVEVDELLQADGMSAEVRERLAVIASGLRHASVELRGAMLTMFDGDPDRLDQSVVDRVRSCAEAVNQRGGPRVHIGLEGTGAEPDRDRADLLVRSAREGLANVVKHAHASEALVILRRGEHWWTVMVEDDGIGDGAVVRQALARSSGVNLGLASLSAEASRLGGRLWLSPAGLLTGVNLSVSVPVRAED